MAEFDDTTMLFLDETTSPNQLNEALGETFTDAFSIPTTSKASPIRGRTMRDFEEKQAQLKKENFNLKLRIYFLEERMSQISGLKDKEEAIKNNIELKVENESLRKELSEKQDLLCQAAKALDILEEQRKTEKQKHIEECASLENRIKDLEKELQESTSTIQQMKFSVMSQSTDSQYSSACFEVDQLSAQVQELQEQIKEDKASINSLEGELVSARKACETHQSILSSLEEIFGVKESDLQNEVQKLLDEVPELRSQIKAYEESISEKDTKYSKLKAFSANLQAKLNTANLELQRLKEEVKSLKRQKQEDLRRKPSDCSNCADNILEKKHILQRYEQQCEEVDSQRKILEKNAVIVRQLMSDLEKQKEEISKLKTKVIAKDSALSEMKEKWKSLQSEVRLKSFKRMPKF